MDDEELLDWTEVPLESDEEGIIHSLEVARGGDLIGFFECWREEGGGPESSDNGIWLSLEETNRFVAVLQKLVDQGKY